MVSDPGVVLEEARSAYKEKDYASSLEKYQWFFDNSIKIKRSYYGVRLSYCLDEWAELGKEYPPAKAALVSLKNNTLTIFKQTKSREAFHEYSSICRSLGNKEEVFNNFLPLHKEKSEIAKELFRFVYEYCAENEKWNICREYLGNGIKKYEESFEIFDHMIKHSKEGEDEIGESMAQEAQDYLQRDIRWILTMLQSSKAEKEYESIVSRIETDLTKIGFHYLVSEIFESTPDKKQKA